MKAKLLSFFIFILVPILSKAQETSEAMGIDERIDKAFQPIADAWAGFVLTRIHFSDSISIPFVVLLLVCGAVFFTVYFAFINIRRFPLAINVVRGKYEDVEKGEADPVKADVFAVDGDIVDTIRDESQEGEVSHFQALATAVSGTVGLGNIAGVAVAISLGGPGATFWMVVCGLIGMSTKFVECTLGVAFRDVDENGVVHGGPMYYLSKGLEKMGFSGLGKVLAAMFAIFCVGASFGGGNAFQSNQATIQLTNMLGLEGGSIKFVVGVILALLVGIVIIGGIKRIAKITEKIVPFMALIYIIASLIVIFANFTYIDDAIGLIISQAFNPTAGLGGLVGVLIVGFQRAAFSNEAGAGSAAIAHSAVRTKYPASEGIVALLEPFIDTVVICSMTALVIIFYNMEAGVPGNIFQYGNLDANDNVVLNSALENGMQTLGGVELTDAAFSAVIPGFSYILTLAIILFAFSTMISWSYYGIQSWKYLFGRSKTSHTIYNILFLSFVVIGASVKLDAVIKFSDAMVMALVFPNMIGLFFLTPFVKQSLNRYLGAIGVSRFFEVKNKKPA